MYTPPVTPWELEMPEVSGPTLISMHDDVIAERSFAIFEKESVGKKQSCIVIREGAAEGRSDDWGEVVTR